VSFSEFAENEIFFGKNIITKPLRSGLRREYSVACHSRTGKRFSSQTRSTDLNEILTTMSEITRSYFGRAIALVGVRTLSRIFNRPVRLVIYRKRIETTRSRANESRDSGDARDFSARYILASREKFPKRRQTVSLSCPRPRGRSL